MLGSRKRGRYFAEIPGPDNNFGYRYLFVVDMFVVDDGGD